MGFRPRRVPIVFALLSCLLRNPLSHFFHQ